MPHHFECALAVIPYQYCETSLSSANKTFTNIYRAGQKSIWNKTLGHIPKTLSYILPPHHLQCALEWFDINVVKIKPASCIWFDLKRQQTHLHEGLRKKYCYLLWNQLLSMGNRSCWQGRKKTDRSTSALTFPKLDKISYIVNQRPFQVDRPVVANAKWPVCCSCLKLVFLKHFQHYSYLRHCCIVA